jgi:hypothetical protein
MSFPLGRVVCTRALLEHLVKIGDSALPYLARHQNQVWGELDPEDKRANDQALRTGGRVLSKYRLKDRVSHIYVITEHDRSYTTLMFCSEY